MRSTFTKNLLILIVAQLGMASVSAQSYQFLNSVPAKPDASIRKMNSVAINSTGDVFIADAAGKSVHVFDSTGTQINIISSIVTDSGTIAFASPSYLCVDANDNLYVYDESLTRVLVKPYQGNGFAIGQKGSELGYFDKVMGIAADSKGYVYVLNGVRKQVDVFSPEGEFITWISGGFNRPFAEPMSLGVNGADELYVLDKEGASVFMFDVTGGAINANRNLANKPGVKISVPVGMAVFRNGDFFILDAVTNTATQFSKLGDVMGTIGTKGAGGNGTFIQVNAIASGAADQNRLVILDGEKNLAQVFSVTTATRALVPSIKRMQLHKDSIDYPLVSDIAIAPNGYRYQIPGGNSQTVEAYNEGTGEKMFSLDGKFGEAVSLATDEFSNVYVLDKKSREVFMYDPKGTLIRKFGKEATEKLKEPTSICIQSTGNIIVADRGNACLHMWNNKGVYQKIITSAKNSVLVSPFLIHVDSKDQIYIWDDKLNKILRTGISGWPTAINGLLVRGEKMGGKEGEIGGFYLDPLNQVHVLNRTTSQLEVYEWELEPVMKFSIGHPGSAGANSFGNIDNIIFNKETFQIHFLQKNQKQLVYQFQVKPPTPENSFVFEVAENKLQVRFTLLTSKNVHGYGLVSASSTGADSLVAHTTTGKFLLDDQRKNLQVHHYGLVSIMNDVYSDPTPGFDDYFGYANQLIAAKRYDEAMIAYEKTLDKMGRSPSMVEFVSHQLSNTGKILAENSELGRALQFLRAAFSLTPKDQETCNAYGWVLSVFFRQLANTDDIQGIISEAERMMATPSIETILLNTIDTLSISMAQQSDERSITNAILLQKKLIEWSPGNYSYKGSLARTTFKLYKFKSVTGIPGLELDLILAEAEKYAQQSGAGLKQTLQPYYEEDLLHLQILNASEKFDQVEILVLAELATATSAMSQDYIFRYRSELALAYAGQGKNDLAEQEYRQLQTMQSENNSITELLAQALVVNKKYDEAQQLYQQLLIKDRNNADYTAQIGNIELLKGNFVEASFQLEKAIKQNPANGSFYGMLAESYDGALNIKRALDNYRISIQYLEGKLSQTAGRIKSSGELTESQARLYHYMARVGELNDQTGNFEEAIKAFNKIIEADASNASAFYGLGKAGLSSGLVYDAVNAFYAACRLDPSNEIYTNAYSNALNLRTQISQNEAPLNILEIHINDVYPSLYKNYSDVNLLPLGEIVVANNTELPITPTSITVFVKELMSQPTQIKSPAMVGYSNSYVLISALFSDKILTYTDDQQFQLDVAIEYTKNQQPKSIHKSVTFTLHGRNAISWVDKRRLAAFVSPNVNELIDYSQKGLQIFKDVPNNGLNNTILKAMKIYTLLDKSNFIYSPDPAQSFAAVTTNTQILDKLQYPTETLKRRSGDCDDLVAMYAGLLENAGVATAYVDVPGHVFMAFDCQMKPDEIRANGLSDHDVIIQYGKVWIPIETTLISTQDFMLAWRSAARRYYQELSDGNFPEIVPLADARTVYVPSIFVPAGFSEVPPGGPDVLDACVSGVTDFLKKTNEAIMKDMESRYEIETGNAFVKNKYAVLLARAGETDKAERIFFEALDLAPANPAVLNNLGNIYLLMELPLNAIEYYEKAAAVDSTDGEILINLCKAHLLQNDKAVAKTYFEKALLLNSELGYVYEYLNTQIK